MRRLLLSIAGIALLAAGCGTDGPTVPDDQRRLTTALGFHIQASDEFLDAGGVVTPEHGLAADRWWAQLMGDLTTAGMRGADPGNIYGYLYIRLMRSRTQTGDILYSDGTTLVGGYYSRMGGSFYVPGDYPTAHWPGRPNSQPLKHEYLHHWCSTVLKKDCLAPGTTSMDRDSHVFPAPNGVNVWDYTWDYGRHDNAVALAHP